MLEVRRGSGIMLPIQRVEMPADAPEYIRHYGVDIEPDFPQALYDQIQQRRAALLEAVHRAVLQQLYRCALFERDSFPCRECLTGDYYLDPHESYDYTEGQPRIIMKARCLGWSDPWNKSDRGRPKDYLGIDVFIEFDPRTNLFTSEPFSLQVIGS